MEEKEKQDRKILQDYYNNLSEKSLHLLDKQTSWASSIDEHSVTFSQFLVSICAGLLAIFFSVKDFNKLKKLQLERVAFLMCSSVGTLQNHYLKNDVSLMDDEPEPEPQQQQKILFYVRALIIKFSEKPFLVKYANNLEKLICVFVVACFIFLLI